MKQLKSIYLNVLYTSIFMIILSMIGCQKETIDPDLMKSKDSIPLYYINLNYDTTCIDYEGVKIMLDITYGIEVIGPRSYTTTSIDLRSSDPSLIKVSHGYSYNPVKYNMIINDSLYWYDEFLCGGYYPSYGSIGYQREYYGLRHISDIDTFYGWIHTPYQRKISEFAVDTSSLREGVVRAGKIWKK